MSRKVVWDPMALDDFNQILDFLCEHDPGAAAATELKIRATLERLAHYSIGRRSRIDGYFEKPVTRTPYTIAYQPTDKAIVVIRIIHQRRQWPEGSWPKA
jgi:plasmid stabilization system protein ParE